MYSGYERESFDDIFDDSLDNFEKEDLPIDKNWYNNIYKGIYLSKSHLDENGEYITKFSSIVNDSAEYKMAVNQVFDVYLSENCREILNNKFRRVNDYFLLNLNYIKSLLSIINEDSKEKIKIFSNDTLMNMWYPESICIDMYFNLFDECQYIKKKV